MNTDVVTCLPFDAPRTAATPPRSARIAPHALLLGRTSVLVAWATLVLAALHPPHGLGVRLCWFQAACGVSCWGCGLSRSFSCSVRAMLTDAWSYHPFGPILLMILVAIVGASLLLSRLRYRSTALLDRFPRITITAYVALVTLFVTFGTLRALLELLF